MSLRWSTSHRSSAASAVALVGALGVLATVPVASSAEPSLDQLGSELGRQQAHQQHLEASLSGMSQLIASLSGQIALVQSREAEVQAELAQDRSNLSAAQAALRREQQLLAALRTRLMTARGRLARQLVSNYESDSPDLVTVVLESNGFRDLLERITYLRDAERQQQAIIAITRALKAKADAAARRLVTLEATDRQITGDAAVRAQALAGMNSLLQSKQGTLERVRSIQRAALSASRARSGQLQAQISQIEAQQAAERAAAAQAARAAQPAQQGSATSSAGRSSPALGPSGGWAIPYAIVLCESGGQNLPPNGAGASGYYQITPPPGSCSADPDPPPTWRAKPNRTPSPAGSGAVEPALPTGHARASSGSIRRARGSAAQARSARPRS